MSFSLVYLVQLFFYRIYEFLRHWYAGGFFAVTHRTLIILEGLDRTIALRVTFRYLFKPMYQDYSVIGHTLGFIFRIARILMGGLVYSVVISAAMAIYLAWAALPLYIVAKGFLLI